ncbi:MAG: lysophospholipid acyltransferase family protein [Parabacteroides sp.]|nr:lysophospholipid acyltransferase family protein [Parabacteroides sp.]
MSVVYHIVNGFWYLLSLLPLCVLYLISDLIFFLLYYCIRYRRKVVRKNLVNSFPDKSLKEIIVVEKGFYAWFCDYVVETIRLRSMSKEELMKRMSFEGLEAIYEEMEQEGKTFCFAYLGHYCNWEWVSTLPLWTKDKLKCAQIYHPLEDEAFNRLFVRLRGRFGSESISMSETLRRIIQLKNEKQKTIIGFIADQTPMWNSIHLWMDFLNQETPVFTGTERIAKQVNACVYYIDITRPRRGYYRAVFKPIVHDEKKPVESEFPITEMYMHLLEETISREPAYWLWSHNRWKRKREVAERRLEEQEKRKEERIKANLAKESGKE